MALAIENYSKTSLPSEPGKSSKLKEMNQCPKFQFFEPILQRFLQLSRLFLVIIGLYSADLLAEPYNNLYGEFGFKLLRETLKEDGPVNSVLSPYAVRIGLAMAASGAKGETLRQLASGSVAPGVWAYPKESPTRLLLANRLWIQKGGSIREGYLDSVEQLFGVRPWLVDFTQAPDFLVDRINGWISEKTNGQIKQILSEDAVNPDAKMLMTSALYFKADWKIPFSKKNDETLRYVGNINYLENSKFQMIDIPYADGETSLVLMLPNPDSSLEYLEKHINLSSFQKWLHQMKKEIVRVTLPKFRFETKHEMKTVLQQFDIIDPFTAGLANFSPISKDRDLYLEGFIHSTQMGITNEGTWVLSSSADPKNVPAKENDSNKEFLSNQTGRVEDEAVFRVDRPFLFIVWQHDWRTVLMAGHVYAPSF